MPRARGDELFLPGEDDERRPPRAQGDERGQVLEEDLLLHPESPADPRLDDADSVKGDVEDPRDDPAHVKRDLGARPDDEPPVLVQVR